MKLKNVLAVAVVSFAVAGCSGQNAVQPTLTDAEIAAKSGAAVDGSDFFIGRFLQRDVFAVLDLTNAQKAQIRGIVESKRDAFHPEERPDKRPTAEERRARRAQMRQEIEAEILGVLTAEQRSKYDELKAQLANGQMPVALIDLRIARLHEKLNLTAEQQDQIRALDTWNAFARLRPDGLQDPREFRQEMKKLIKAHEAQLMLILTPEQQATFTELKAERRRHNQAGLRRFFMQAKRVFGRLSDALDLDESQRQQLQEILAGARDALPEDLAALGREELEELRHAMMAEIDAQIRAILTPEQLEKYETLQAERRKHRGRGRRRGRGHN